MGFWVFDGGLAGADWSSGAFSTGFGGFLPGVGSIGASDFVGDSGVSGELTGVAGFGAAGAREGVGVVLGLFLGALAGEAGLTAGVVIGLFSGLWSKARRSLASGKGGWTSGSLARSGRRAGSGRAIIVSISSEAIVSGLTPVLRRFFRRSWIFSALATE